VRGHIRERFSLRDVVPTKVSPGAEKWKLFHLYTPGSLSIHRDERWYCQEVVF